MRVTPHVAQNLTRRGGGAIDRRTTQHEIERHIYLRALQDTNEILFYRLLDAHVEEMTPIVYTPVVALGCQQFSEIYRRPRGLFISDPLRDSIPSLLQNRLNPDVDIIVVTDGEQILGVAIKAWEGWEYLLRTLRHFRSVQFSRNVIVMSHDTGHSSPFR
jgi:Malic enzyme, N-terminal domain